MLCSWPYDVSLDESDEFTKQITPVLSLTMTSEVPPTIDLIFFMLCLKCKRLLKNTVMRRLHVMPIYTGIPTQDSQHHKYSPHMYKWNYHNESQS